jgi:uncharacterized protein VirK/YbjX
VNESSLSAKAEEIVGREVFNPFLRGEEIISRKDAKERRGMLTWATSLLGLPMKLRKASFQLFPATGWSNSWLRFKFLVRGLIYGAWMAPWCEFLELPGMRPFAAKHGRLYLKIQWLYLNDKYRPGKRLEIVRNHYQFVLDRFPKELLSRLTSAEFLHLAYWTVPDLGRFSLRLSHENNFAQEGEMVLDLCHEDSKRPCALLCFSISGLSEISIGCLQGGKPVAGDEEISSKDLTIALTRGMHGLRPKNLLLFALRQLAAIWAISGLRAVSTERHINAKEFQADYNTFWEEAGGALSADGMYDLSSSFGFRDLQEIKSKKRAMYRHRYRFLETLGQEIERTVAAPGRSLNILEVKPATEAVGR